jgi:hypothetical protein
MEQIPEETGDQVEDGSEQEFQDAAEECVNDETWGVPCVN